MDALPVQKQMILLISQKMRKMHACGHDGHMSMALGAAKFCLKTKILMEQFILYFSPMRKKLKVPKL